ncbi:MAG: signal peptidase I [Thermomicrobiales bacterium]
MRPQPRRPHFRSIAVIAVILVLGWIFLAPPLLGGRTSYVIVNGNSMEPHYERGDLVLVRSQGGYQVGDIVTYRHPEIGPIIHRIIDQDGARFILQGDNNDWLDSYKPLPSEVIGEEWVHLPKVGKAITWVRGPGLAVFIVAVIGAGVMLPSDQRRVGQRVSRAPRGAPRPERNLREQRQARRQQRPERSASGTSWLDQRTRDALGWVGLIAVACLIAGGFAFTRPTERAVTVDATYDQTGQFSYGAAAPSGIYDAAEVATGDPIFRAVSDTVAVGFDYAFSSELPATVSGNWDLNAVLSTDNGWSRTVPLITDKSFTGPAFSAEATIDLAALRAITDSVTEQTGVSHDRFLLTVVPQVSVDGSLGGQPFSDVFTPELSFNGDPMELTFVSGGEEDSLSPSRTGIVKLPEIEANTIPVLNWEVSVTLARVLAILGVILATVSAFVVATLAIQANRTGAGGRVPSRYNAMLVDISDPDPAMTGHGQIVAVRSFDDLARLAERDGQVILRHAANGIERFMVRCADITYQYSPSPTPEPAR